MHKSVRGPLLRCRPPALTAGCWGTPVAAGDELNDANDPILPPRRRRLCIAACDTELDAQKIGAAARNYEIDDRSSAALLFASICGKIESEHACVIGGPVQYLTMPQGAARIVIAARQCSSMLRRENS